MFLVGGINSSLFAQKTDELWNCLQKEKSKYADGIKATGIIKKIFSKTIGLQVY